MGAALAGGRPELLVSDTVTAGRPGQRQAARPDRGGADASREELLELARESEKVRRHLDGKEVVKEVVVPGKLVNLVVR